MRKILFLSTKENIEMSYPGWAYSLMMLVSKYIKVKTIKKVNGSKFRSVIIDEVYNP